LLPRDWRIFCGKPVPTFPENALIATTRASWQASNDGVDKLLADKDCDSDRFRASIAAAGAEAEIPSTRSRSQAIPYDKHVYGDRNLVQRFFNEIKHFRRIATRYEKTALSFASILFLVSAMIWLR
jgi:transposase